MLPFSGSRFAASRSNSSSRLPSSTTTRVSSAWEASISMRFVIEACAPRRSGQFLLRRAADRGGAARTTRRGRRGLRTCGGLLLAPAGRAHGAAGAPTMVAARHGHPGSRPGFMPLRLASLAQTVRRIARGGGRGGVGQPNVHGGRADVRRRLRCAARPVPHGRKGATRARTLGGQPDEARKPGPAEAGSGPCRVFREATTGFSEPRRRRPALNLRRQRAPPGEAA
jgi:hypothetical protein